MTKLTTKKNWSNQTSLDEVHKAINFLSNYEWIRIVKAEITNKNLFSLLELGCCPGQFSRILSNDNIKDFSGIDFIDCKKIYSSLLSPIANNITFIHDDLLRQNRKLKKHDIVCSFGLLEHFSGDELNKVLSLHDLYLNQNGYLVIEIPNMAGIKFIWHFIFDRKNLKLHNLHLMNLNVFDYYKNLGYKEIFKGYTDSPEFWGWSTFSSLNRKSKIVSIVCFLSRCANIFFKTASKFIRCRNFFWSSFILYVAVKPSK
jgi:hypothetical protein